MKVKFYFSFFVFMLFLLSSTFSAVNSKEVNMKKLYLEGKRMISAKNYKEALKLYLEMDAKLSNANIQYHIGLCYLKSPVTADKILSTSYFEKVLPSVSEKYVDSFDEVNAPLETYYCLAESYLVQYQADKSMQLLGIFKSCLKKDKESVNRANRLIKASEKLKSNFIFAHNEMYTINKINKQPLNLNSAETSKTQQILRYTKDSKLIYSTMDDKMYLIKQNTSNGKWDKPTEIVFDNTLDKLVQAERIFVTKVIKGQNNDLYESKFLSDKLSELVKLNENINSKFDETSACITLDGNILYFSSNRKGGYGGFDIYKVEKMSNGEWGKAQNLGPSVNSDLDEVTPFILADGATLYFSSKGHASLGGFDVFSSTISEDGFWSKAENLGFPINTVKDDFNYCLSTDETNAFYISSKDNDSFDIFQLELNK